MCRCTDAVLISRPQQICDPSVFLSSGVCLIVNESGGNTTKKGGPNKKDGSYDFGLFQVSALQNRQF